MNSEGVGWGVQELLWTRILGELVVNTRTSTHLHRVEGAGQPEDGGESDEAEGNDASAHLKLHEVADVVEDALALLYGRAGVVKSLL